jgi:DNA-binding response OmpR family regulator
MKILIIEDDKNILEFLKPNLKTEGFVIDSADNGKDGLFLANTNHYNLILLDYNLPDKNGNEICKEIRKRGKNLPILMLSVNDSTDNKVKLLNCGADDYLVKPFAFDELVARMKALLRRPEEISKDIIQIDDLILDKNKEKVIRGDKEIYLTLKEFSLLEFLMKNQGNIITRASILESIWDGDVNPFSNTIETHILNLRKKIDKDFSKKLIKTIPGRGYKIE